MILVNQIKISTLATLKQVWNSDSATGTEPTLVNEDKFHIHDGHPTFDRKYSDPVDANEYAAHLIKPVYREGWTLPELPTL